MIYTKVVNKNIIYTANIAFELGKWAFILVLIGSLFHYFLMTVFVISGPSMEISFHNGQVVLVSRIGLFTNQYQRGDPMVVKFPGDPEKKKYIKRLVGLPGETVEVKNNEVYVNGKQLVETYIRPVGDDCPSQPNCNPAFYENPEWEIEAAQLHSQGKVLSKPDVKMILAKDEYFLMGDNRENSNDSRKWGAAKREHVIGPVRFVVFPLRDWGPIVNPVYN